MFLIVFGFGYFGNDRSCIRYDVGYIFYLYM